MNLKKHGIYRFLPALEIDKLKKNLVFCHPPSHLFPPPPLPPPAYLKVCDRN